MARTHRAPATRAGGRRIREQGGAEPLLPQDPLTRRTLQPPARDERGGLVLLEDGGDERLDLLSASCLLAWMNPLPTAADAVRPRPGAASHLRRAHAPAPPQAPRRLLQHQVLRRWLQLLIRFCSSTGCKPLKLGMRAGNTRRGHGCWIGWCPRSTASSRLHRHRRRRGSASATNIEVDFGCLASRVCVRWPCRLGLVLPSSCSSSPSPCDDDVYKH